MIRVNLYKMKNSMKAAYGSRGFIEIKREFLDSCILRLFENVWTSTLHEVGLMENESNNSQLMLEQIYNFFYTGHDAGNLGIAITVGDVLEIEQWTAPKEGSAMILTHADRYFCEATGFQPLDTYIIDVLRIKPEFKDKISTGMPIREQINYLYNVIKTSTTADLFGLDSKEYLSHGCIDIPQVLTLLKGIEGVDVETGDILQFNGTQRYLFNGIEWIPQLTGRVKKAMQYKGVPAVF